MQFIPNECFTAIFLGKPLYKSLLVLIYPLRKIWCNPCVKCAIAFVRDDVNAKLFHVCILCNQTYSFFVWIASPKARNDRRKVCTWNTNRHCAEGQSPDKAIQNYWRKTGKTGLLPSVSCKGEAMTIREALASSFHTWWHLKMMFFISIVCRFPIQSGLNCPICYVYKS